MSAVLSNVVYTAKKTHWCCQCRSVIKPTEKYRRQTYVDCGEFSTYKAHTDCDEAAIEYYNLAGIGYDDEAYALDDCMYEKDDREWLLKEYPTVAARMRIK